MNRRLLLLLFISAIGTTLQAQAVIRVACVGDSVCDLAVVELEAQAPALAAHFMAGLSSH